MKLLKNTFIIMLLFSMVFNLSSCKKDDPNTNQENVNWGYVKEFYTEKPIANATVVIYSRNPLWTVEDTLYTDSNGRYEFPIVKYLPYLEVSANGYIPNRMFDQDELVGRFNRTILLYQPAEMILHVKNVNPNDENDNIRLNDFHPYKVVNGKNVDTLICCLVGLRYQTVRTQTVVRRIRNGLFTDSIIVFTATPTKSQGNIINIYY